MSDNNTVINETAYIPYKPERFELFKKDYIFALFAFIISVITSAFGLWGGFRCGMTVAIILLISAVTVYLVSKDVRLRIFPLVCGILAVLVSLSFTLTTNGTIRFLSIIFCGLLSLIWFTNLIAEQKESGDLDLFRSIFAPIFALALPLIPTAVVSLFQGGGEKNKKVGKALLGCLASMPLLMVIIPLLISSDEAFSGMAELLFGNLFLNIFKIIVGAVISLFVISYGFSLKKRELPEKRESNFSGAENTAVIAFLSVISVCYLSYLFSQLAYFFSAFKGFLPENYQFTVSAYARRGFFEMSVISAINFLLIFIVLLISKKQNGKVCLSIKLLCTFIAFFTLIIITTALSKMVLYIKSFGMTQLRIGTSGFMIALGIIFISLILRIYIPKIRVVRTSVISFGIILVLFGTFNINSVIGEYNYYAYKSGMLETVDTRALYDLGAEGIPYLIKLSDSEDGEISFEAQGYIYEALCYGSYEYTIDETNEGYTVGKNETARTGLGSYSYPFMRAERLLNKYIKENGEHIEEQWENRYSEDNEFYY